MTNNQVHDITQQIAWQARYEAFGVVTVDGDVDGDGQALTFNLRYPGQYFDLETGLHYNYFRNYDPSVGKYIQSDPIRLRGGINTYAYTRNNPIRHIDPTGELVQVPVVGLYYVGLLIISYIIIDDFVDNTLDPEFFALLDDDEDANDLGFPTEAANDPTFGDGGGGGDGDDPCRKALRNCLKKHNSEFTPEDHDAVMGGQECPAAEFLNVTGMKCQQAYIRCQSGLPHEFPD